MRIRRVALVSFCVLACSCARILEFDAFEGGGTRDPASGDDGGAGTSGGGGAGGAAAKLPPWPTTCFDGKKSAGETDVDCGGACPRCARDKGCSKDADCWNDTCQQISGTCGVDCPPGMTRFRTQATSDPTSARDFCVDRYEVSQADYLHRFLDRGPAQGRQDPVCALLNTSFLPATTASNGSRPPCTDNSFRPAERGTHPVTCVDHCDALAYCREQGKFLCGLAGDPTGVLLPGSAMTPTGNALYAACVAGESMDDQYLYPYGTTYQEKACVTKDYGSGTAPVGEAQVCRSAQASTGGSAFDLAANVAEWTMACGAGDMTCMVHGGSFTQGADAQCGLMEPVKATSAFADVGFRCCG